MARNGHVPVSPGEREESTSRVLRAWGRIAGSLILYGYGKHTLCLCSSEWLERWHLWNNRAAMSSKPNHHGMIFHSAFKWPVHMSLLSKMASHILP